MSTKPYSEWSSREIIDHAERELVKQGKQSLNIHGSCVYLSDEGLRCGAGLFLKGVLTDEQILSKLAGYIAGSISSKTVRDVFVKAGFMESQISLLSQIQQVHDFTPPSEWPIAFSRLRWKY
jgi:hypothetical protein